MSQHGCSCCMQDAFGGETVVAWHSDVTCPTYTYGKFGSQPLDTYGPWTETYPLWCALQRFPKDGGHYTSHHRIWMEKNTYAVYDDNWATGKKSPWLFSTFDDDSKHG